MKPMRKILLALTSVAALTLAACATPTPYQPADPKSSASFARGYQEQRIESNRYRLSFSGNTSTPRETVEDYMLFRAAELTLENGYDWFTLAHRNTEENKTYRTTVSRDPFYSPFYGSLSWRYYQRNRWSRWGFGYSAFDEVDTQEFRRYEANAEVIFGKGPKPANDAMAFDAREVKQNLEPRVVRPAAK
ncbi:CC0125/CC1285 family lipoprotein [Asticcacaulis endophyticus]|uniref:DUF4136 domain-containing protein n=1 Tax=Asticcacaulis endophyticus TaxID=1395890 RepID=A0A918PUG4_9CAUL|nr:hypothetical protein [Asticcacaulis endophyticus]GGZ23625.1 hypothetical protein GCM10011273_05820 [Asticcacaulis endophyticus]